MEQNKKHRSKSTTSLPIGYTCICTYSLPSKDYTETNKDFNLYAKTYTGLVAKIKKAYEKYIDDTHFTLYKAWNWEDSFRPIPSHGTFTAAYIFGPMVHYDIYIRPIYLESLED